ncbi:site-specific integrase [Bradyrhizobium canariense]|uniref:site-specific integrase n=1 Tax=Bradyrhizobium canariense TaxID=255045 RepID=UPI001B8A3212|nr:site-specific integrase [Bradyrhizobium canariense]MBR0950336.1 site-specific integrase [Bradyrhizobium canariense]
MVRFESGELFPAILDRSGVPLREPVFFFEKERHFAFNTLDAKARVVAMVHDFLQERGIDLRDRVRQGLLLQVLEATSLGKRLRSIGPRTDLIRERQQQKTRSTPKIPIVGGHEWSHRRRRTVQYLKWLSERICDELRLPVAERESVKAELAKLNELLVDQAKSMAQPVLPALSMEQGFALLDAILPDLPANPFPSQQFRNFVLILAFWETGLRKSEILGLEVGDLSPTGSPPTLKLVRRPNYKKDTRARPAALKTMPRTVPITPVLHACLVHYINEHRRKVEFALRDQGDKAGVKRFKSHAFIFVGARGAPLSCSGLQKIFATLGMRIPELPAQFSPHALRRTWNDLFTELSAERLGPRETQIREYLMGWVRGSRQSAHYAMRTTQRQAAEAVQQLQRDWVARWKETKECQRT